MAGQGIGEVHDAVWPLCLPRGMGAPDQPGPLGVQHPVADDCATLRIAARYAAGRPRR
jgi:hypothetical protein